MSTRKLLCRSQTRIDLLFTMSEITHAAVLMRTSDMRSDVSRTILNGALSAGHFVDLRFHLVEPDGIEPTTSCLQSTRSPS